MAAMRQKRPLLNSVAAGETDRSFICYCLEGRGVAKFKQAMQLWRKAQGRLKRRSARACREAPLRVETLDLRRIRERLPSGFERLDPGVSTSALRRYRCKIVLGWQNENSWPVYGLLETTRCYAPEKLRESGEFDAIARHHEGCEDVASKVEVVAAR
jgi:hypothetical protein